MYINRLERLRRRRPSLFLAKKSMFTFTKLCLDVIFVVKSTFEQTRYTDNKAWQS